MPESRERRSAPSLVTRVRESESFVARFLRTEAAGGIVLVAATAVALAWANSPWDNAYESFAHDAHHVVNDGLMAIFFLVVGLEIKRELATGGLRDPRVAALPALAAVGGMVVPALLYVAFNAGGAGSRGWGIPMATDIAFAAGVVALVGQRVPSSLKLFLLSLAIVDDIGAILVIAVVYSSGLDLTALALAVAAFGAAVVLVRHRVSWPPVYLVLAVGCWWATYRSGVHATIAGVAFGLLAPMDSSDDVTTGGERLERLLHPVTSFAIVPVFALANAGVEIRSDALDGRGAGAVAIGIVVGLVAGKLVGVFGASWLAARFTGAALPQDATWPAMAGIATTAGIGFTVSLFVAGLAFDDPALVAAAKLAVLVASVVAALAGAAVLRIAPGRVGATRPRRR